MPVPFLSSYWSLSDQMWFFIFTFLVASGCEGPTSHLEKTLQALKLHEAVIQQLVKSTFQVADQECHRLVGWTPDSVWKCSVSLSVLYRKGQQLFVIIRHCPSASLWSSVESGTAQLLPAGRTPCAVGWAALSALSDSSPELYCQVIPWCPSLVIMLTQPQDVFTSRSAVVARWYFPSAAKPLAWCMLAVASFPSLLFLSLRISAHHLLRNEHRAYKLDDGNYLQNQIWMLQPKQT